MNKIKLLNKNSDHTFSSKNNLKFTYTLLLMVACIFISNAQTITTIKGNIVDSNGELLIGATIIEKGTTNGTQADFDGNFSLENVKSDGILVVSYVGFKTVEISINGQSNINVALEIDSDELEEIVLIGYGSQKKSDLTGSVGKVNADQLAERQIASVNQALAGKVAGVQVQTNSGRPGGRTNIRVRGFSSINTGNNPLYVVDGVQLPQGGQSLGTTAIDFINPADIQSIEVLKDASATAIYGSRGANGVILITTKKGESGEGKFTYNTDFFVNVWGPNRPEVLNSEQYQMVEQLAWENSEKFDPAGWAAGNYTLMEPRLRRQDPSVSHLFNSDGTAIYDTKWHKEATQQVLSQNHNFGFSGGNEKTKYSITLGLRDEKGFLLESTLKRYSARFNIEDQIKPWLKIGGTLDFNNQTSNPQDTRDAVPRQIVEDFPFMPVRYETGPRIGEYGNNRDYPYAEGTQNSVKWLEEFSFDYTAQNLIGSFYTNINLTEDLEFRSVLGSNVLQQKRRVFLPGSINNNFPVAFVWSNNNIFWSAENYLTYNKEINENNSITGLLGVSWQQSDFEELQGRGFPLPSDGLRTNNLNSGSNQFAYSSKNRRALNSFFTRINYNLMNKYLFTFTGRADGSSVFGDNNKYSFFPSAAFAWRVSEEDFLLDSSSISNLKIRASYGLTGNSDIPPYSSLGVLNSSYYGIFNESRFGGTGLGTLSNPNLRWEQTAQYDIGFEIGLFDNKISIEADYYYRKTTDMLLNAPVPRSSGYSTIRKNIGSMENKGLELSVSTKNISTTDIIWNTMFNISGNRNKVLKLATPADIFYVGGPGFTNPTGIIREGEPLGAMWGLTRLGTWNTDEAAEAARFVSYRGGNTMLPGDIKYKDFNGDYVINDEDRTIIGNGYPTAWGTLTNYVKYKNLDLTFDIQYSWGNDVMNLNLHASEDRQDLANSYTTVLNAWTPDNQDTMIAQVRNTRAGYVTNVDTHWVQDASFIRGQNFVLGYTFGPEFLERVKLSNMRIYGSAQNFFLITKDELLGDPEVSPILGGPNVAAQGIKWHEFPKPTTFTVGLQISL
jgi:TonB-dependent starch-binding outer membrane protein SusC